MAATPNDRRQQLLWLRGRIKRQLRSLAAIRVELHDINADQFMRPVAADGYPWLLAVEPTRRALATRPPIDKGAYCPVDLSLLRMLSGRAQSKRQQ